MAIVSNVSKYPIELASEDGDTCMIPVGKNISISDKFLANVLPGIKVVQGNIPVKKVSSNLVKNETSVVGKNETIVADKSKKSVKKTEEPEDF